MAVLTITKTNFKEEVLNADKPVLIDFWAPWCGPCKMFSPVIDTVAAENEGTIKVGKINIDDDPALAEEYGVMSIPTVVLFKNGENVGVSVGVKSKAEIGTFLGL